MVRVRLPVELTSAIRKDGAEVAGDGRGADHFDGGGDDRQRVGPRRCRGWRSCRRYSPRPARGCPLAEVELARLTAATRAVSLHATGMVGLRRGGESGQAPGQDGGPDQGLDEWCGCVA